MITGQIKRGGSLAGSVKQSGSLAPEIFWVTYGTTTAEEINQAITEQKVCVMSRDNSFYYLIRYTATEYFFASFDTTGEKIKYYRFYNNSWYYNTVTYQEALTFDTKPKQFSNNPVRSYGIWNAIQAAKTTVDATLSATSENPVQNRSVYEALATKADLSSVEPFVQDAVDEWMETYAPTIGTLSNAAKRALLNCFAHVAWIDDQGQSYYNALESELFPDATLESITAVFTQGSAVIYDTDSLDTLKQYLVVTANYSDSTTATVTDYTLSGTLIEGTSTITVSYGGKTDTFTVTVSSSYAFLGGYSIAPRSGSIDVKIFKDTNNARCGCVYATGTHPYPKDSSASALLGDWYPVPIPQGATSMIVTMPSALYVGVRIFAWNASQSYYDNTNGFSSSWTASNASTFDVSSYNDGSWFAGFTFKVGTAGKTDMRNYDMSGVAISFE